MTTALLAEVPRPVASIPLARPEPRAMDVPRTALTRRLTDPAGPALILVVAPAGYGKTTLLREWARRDRRPFAWVRAVDEAVSEAVDRAGGDPCVLVLDDAHALPDSGDLAALAADLPPHVTLAVASRRHVRLPLARLRVEHAVTELGPRDLAMDRAEAARLLATRGHHLDRATLDALVHRTEGWPAALTLAALYLGDAGGRPNVARFTGADRLVADYVRDELLRDLPADARAFVLRTCVADTLTGSLCDVLTGGRQAGAMLEALGRDGLVLPVDRTGECYRYPRLLHEALRAELRRHEPELERELHERASGWHRARGDVDRAVRHALAAGDARAAGDLVWHGVAAQVAAGQPGVVERWLALFDAGEVGRQPRLALVAGACELVAGRAHLAEHWTAAAADAPSADAAIDAGVALLRAALAADGPERMRADALRAQHALPCRGARHALACLLQGAAARLLGDADAATPLLRAGARRAGVVAPHLRAVCLSELAALALERGDWDELNEYGARARAQADQPALRDAPMCAHAFATSAVARAHRGRIEEARADLDHATALLARLADFPAWYRAEVHLLLARAALRLSDVCVARAHAQDAARLMRRVPDAEGLAAQHAATVALIDAFTAPSAAQPTPMTAAELRILRFLPTHLTFREIAERSEVSANTVKTHANAVYRKFGVACRSDAVARARACGLLD